VIERALAVALLTLSGCSAPVHRSLADEVATGANRGTTPHFSPDGRRIVFAFPTDRNRQELFIIDTEGKNLRRPAPDFSFAGYANWTADGSGIVFLAERDGNPSALFLMTDNGTNLRRLTRPSDHPERDLLLSPDRSSAVFTRSVETLFGASTEVFAIDLAAPHIERQLTSNGWDNSIEEFTGTTVTFGSEVLPRPFSGKPSTVRTRLHLANRTSEVLVEADSTTERAGAWFEVDRRADPTESHLMLNENGTKRLLTIKGTVLAQSQSPASKQLAFVFSRSFPDPGGDRTLAICDTTTGEISELHVVPSRGP